MPSKKYPSNANATSAATSNVSKLKAETELTKEVKELAQEVRKLKDMELLQVFKNPWKFMWFSLWKGIMVGFGSALGATLLLALFVYILGEISVVPYLGDFIQSIIEEIQPNK